MAAFDVNPPEWTNSATHALHFCCPRCGAGPMSAQRVWLNRRSPVYTEGHRRKYQEFYHCQCDFVWWVWSDQRPPSDLSKDQRSPLDDFDDL